MESRSIQINSKKNKKININVIPGHFATSHSHVNYYIDMTGIKANALRAKETAEEIASAYSTNNLIDTIICMDGCEIIGAYLASCLTSAGTMHDVSVIMPEYTSSGQMFFRDNLQSMIWNKRVLILIASATTGKTINRLMECVQYYSGNTVGICAIFSAIDKMNDIEINSLFGVDEISDYETYTSHSCPQCQAKKKLDAIVNSSGYSKL